mgnify:CR=1 FL=1
MYRLFSADEPADAFFDWPETPERLTEREIKREAKKGRLRDLS